MRGDGAASECGPFPTHPALRRATANRLYLSGQPTSGLLWKNAAGLVVGRRLVISDGRCESGSHACSNAPGSIDGSARHRLLASEGDQSLEEIHAPFVSLRPAPGSIVIRRFGHSVGADGGSKMQYQIEFLDDVNTIVRMAPTIAESPAIAFQLVLAKGWPRGARTAHVIDSHGHLTKFKI